MNRSALMMIAAVGLTGTIVVAAFRGCDSSMPKGANARLIANVYHDRTKGSTDVVLLGRFKSQTELTTRTKGDWITTRYLVVFDIVSVEQGRWDEPTLAFVASDSWPAPESGILVKKMPWPYRPGVTMWFELERPNRIVSQQPVVTSQPVGALDG